VSLVEEREEREKEGRVERETNMRSPYRSRSLRLKLMTLVEVMVTLAIPGLLKMMTVEDQTSEKSAQERSGKRKKEGNERSSSLSPFEPDCLTTTLVPSDPSYFCFFLGGGAESDLADGSVSSEEVEEGVEERGRGKMATRRLMTSC